MNWRQQTIDTDYNGDAKRFEANYAEAIAEGNRLAVRWDDLLVDATTLPHLKETGRELIKINLGYLPPDQVMLPYEPYLRALIQNYWQNAIAENDFLDQLEDHIKIIRNADMKHNTCLAYDEAIYQNYHATFAPFGYAVRERLTRFLGYEPQLEHSLIAEMWMRGIMADDTYKLPDEITSDDIRAITLVKYREVFLKDGKSVADMSSVLMEKH
ncbi:hypothetical protein [Spirosoma sp. KNUC1025]|uniref:hypothetical protein n=1 Tax=Spirosoma sp. KNUC1025 TaxID=2894082 RepID=UPI0038642A25|nr:hypothetical protein LN737_01145 [Spirosoma sp. KNUC1025]